ncbi:murein L,D-transpeptidase [Paracoccus sp. (in: a-proteobacteria)]|uniref:L,D-transpeptidase family protein n=1 Tax=Paracoccus sp. TaxID=267 RepID=UPI00396C7A65
MTARRFGSILAVVLGMAGASMPTSLMSQDHAGAVIAAAAPRLHFTPAQMELARAVADDPDLAAFYGTNGLSTIFLGENEAPLRAALRAAIMEMPRHGIPSSRYAPDTLSDAADRLSDELAHARQAARLLRDLTGGVLTPSHADPEIKRIVKRPSIPDLLSRLQHETDPGHVFAEAAPRHPAYLALQTALNGPAELAVPAGLPFAPESVWHVGDRGEGVHTLRTRLTAIGFGAEPAGDAAVYDAALSQAVARYQQAAGLPDDGVAGPRTIAMLNGDGLSGQQARQRAILVAMERLRWMRGEDLSARHVWVNIPEFTTIIVENGQEVFRTRSVIGKDTAEMRTPEFSERMSNLVVNPSWNVPRSITVRDYLPKLQGNRHALSHLEVVDKAGRVVARDGVDFSRFTAANFPYRLRQKPSDDNALGIVKFIFPNPWNIYLHDTPTKHLFGNSVRAYSNGCIRIGDPVDLAHALLSVQSDDPAGVFQRARDSGRETWVSLRPAVPVHLVYFTAWPDAQGRVRLFDDIYGRDARVWHALEAEGVGAPARL